MLYKDLMVTTNQKICNRYTHQKRKRDTGLTLKKVIKSQEKRTKDRKKETYRNKSRTSLLQDKRGHYIMIKGSIQEEAIIIVNIYAPNIAPQCIMQMLTDIKGEIDSNTIMCCAAVLSHFSHTPLSATLWTVAYHAPLFTGFFRQEYWGGLPFHSLEDLPDPGFELASPVSPALQGDSLPLSHWFYILHTHTHTQTHKLGDFNIPLTSMDRSCRPKNQ